MKTDRELAVEYITTHYSPGEHMKASILGAYINRKKSETLRVINWLCESGYLKRIGSGPSTCYLVEDFVVPNVTPINRDHEIVDGDYPEDIKCQPGVFTESCAADAFRYLSLEAKPSLKPLDAAIKKLEADDNQILKETQEKINKRLAQKYFILSVRIQDDLEAVKKYISHVQAFQDAMRSVRREDLIDPALLSKLVGEQRILESLAKDLV